MPDPLNLGAVCALWLKADDPTTIHATGGLVDQWDDKAGYFTNRQVTATGAARPQTGVRAINGKNAVYFDGADLMQTVASFGLAMPYTIGTVAVADAGADSTNQTIVRDVTNGYGVGKSLQNNWVAFAGNDAHFGGMDDHLHRMVWMMKSGSVGRINLDGTESGNLNVGAGTSQGGLRIGAPSWRGPVCEVVVYTVELNATQRTALIDYFLPWTTGGTARTLIAKVPTATKTTTAALTTVSHSKSLTGKAGTATGAKQGNVLRFR